MGQTTRKGLGLGGLVGWVVLAFVLSLASACSNTTGPKYPPPVDSTTTDTTKTG